LTILDTNILIHYLKGHPSVVSRLQSTSPRQLAIPSIVGYEIEYGTLKTGTSRRREIVSQLLAGIQQIPFDGEAALEAARIRVDLESRGLSIGPMDLLIAGTAASRGAILASNKTKEFSRIKGLRLADWTK
jgi:tRNA(fMet)-specific endonuclease VapC